MWAGRKFAVFSIHVTEKGLNKPRKCWFKIMDEDAYYQIITSFMHILCVILVFFRLLYTTWTLEHCSK